jgi:rhamnose transport system permease protein
MPKSTRNPYFEACRLGAEEAASEMRFALRWEGPEESNVLAQAGVIRSWIRDGLPVMAVSVEDAPRLSPVLREARAKGARVLTWDADADRDARDFTVVQATASSVGHALAFEVGRMLGGKGSFGVITSSLKSPNQAAWLAELRHHISSHYPELEMVAVRACDDREESARREAETLLDTYPQLGALVGLCSPAVPGSAAAVKRSGRSSVRVTGVSLPMLCRDSLEDGTVGSVVIWSARKLGYLAAAAAHALASGVLKPGATTLRAGRLGNVVVRDDEIRLGRVHIVTKGNLEAFVS